MEIDSKDMKILDVLKENSKQSTYKIARKTLLPVTTVHNRIKKLEHRGIIKKYTIIIDEKKLGKVLTAYILVHYDISLWGKEEKAREDLKRFLLALPTVSEVNYITGRYDIMLKSKIGSMEELNDLLLGKLRKIPGVGHTETIFVLESLK